MLEIFETLNPLIRNLVGNYNAISADELDDWMRGGKVSRADLRKVMPEQMLNDYEQHPDQPTIPVGAGLEVLRQTQKDCTEVYVWGRKGAGKSAVIGSILAAQPESLERENQGDALIRAQHLADCFAEHGNLVMLPDEEFDSTTPQVTCIELRGHEHRILPNPGHRLALIECPGESDSLPIEPTGVKRSKREQIHLLCWDATYEKEELQEQMFRRLLRELRRCKALDHTVGIYLLVTKVDMLMTLNRKYREQIAQQIITAGHIQLWSEVKNLCWDMDIHDATPIPFTVGEVFLQQLVRVDLCHARRLSDGPLLLKSQRNRTTIEKVLMMGSLGMSIALIALMAAGLGYGVYSAFASISEPPSEVIEIPDYRSYFIEQVETRVQGRTFDQSQPYYRDLRTKLDLERAILTLEEETLLPDSVLEPCQTSLLESFAPILHRRNRQEMEGESWPGVGMLLGYNRDILKMPKLSYRDRKLIAEDLAVFENYNLACRRITKSNECKSMADVDSVLWASRNLQVEPLTNNKHIREGLQQGPTTAHESYAKYLSKQVNASINNRERCMTLRSNLQELRGRTADGEVARTVIDQALKRIEERHLRNQSLLSGQAFRQLWNQAKKDVKKAIGQ